MAESHRLAPCPSTPNCVSTEEPEAGKRMEPIPFSGAAQLAVKRLVEVIEGMTGGRVKQREALYVHAEFTSRVFRFVDDVDLVIDDEAKVVRFRSASRAGRWDLGANRRRMNELRRRFVGG